VALFTILTGAQASVVRAAIMGAIVLLARREGRLNDPHNAIVLAGAAMILINPLVLRYDIGFQLSFAATLGLIYLAPAIEKYFAKLPKFFQLRETMIMTVSAQIFVLPLLLYYFKNFSVISLPANLIILPTIPFAMVLGFITGLAGLIMPFLGQIVGYFAWFLTSLQLWIVKVLAKPDWAAISLELKWYSIVIAYILLVWLVVKIKKAKTFSSL
jgi:competence protein ComEC